MTCHDCKHDRAHGHIAEQKPNGTACYEGVGGPNEQPSANDTTETARTLIGTRREEKGASYLIMATCRFLSCLWSP